MPDEHPAFLGAGREHPEQHALEHQVRLVGQDLPVLERPRLGLVRVADRVLRRRDLRRDQFPLPPGGEPGAAHAAQPAVGQRRGDLAGVHLAGEHGAQDPVMFRRRGVRIVGPPPGPGRGGRCRSVRRSAVTRRGDQGVHPGQRHRGLVDHGGRRGVAPADAGPLDQLDVGVRPVTFPDLFEPVIGAPQPAGQVVADAQHDPFRRRGPEVRIERDQPLDLVQRPVHLAGQRHQFLAGQPADPFLDGLQGRDQARPGEFAGPRLDAGHRGRDVRHGPLQSARLRSAPLRSGPRRT